MSLLTLALAAGVTVIYNPPQPRPCEMPGFIVRLPGGSELRAVSATLDPETATAVITLEAPGRVYCDGFEL